MSSSTAFMIAALSRPSTVGAMVPSSRRLADAMARAAGGSQLIELGAGTGAITAALCRMHLDLPIMAVELDPRLAQLLRERFLIERPASRLIQFTHLPWEPFRLRCGEALRWRRRASVWRNMPPASIWELSASA
jgi:phosphatidylethanolamine/phosphatidyl-N-methylethanolamine N-methyltransferase